MITTVDDNKADIKEETATTTRAEIMTKVIVIGETANSDRTTNNQVSESNAGHLNSCRTEQLEATTIKTKPKYKMRFSQAGRRPPIVNLRSS